jgi:EmrB/QacA subfamily drug resistance transporter
MPPRDARSSASLYDEPTPPVPPDARPARIVERPGGFRGRVVERLEEGGSYPRWVLWAALAGMFATTFPVTILTVSLGAIAREFGARETTMAWVISAPMLLSAAALPLLGKLGDLYGHRRVFLSGFAAATVAAVLSATAWSPLSLIGFRTLAAVVGGATQPTAMALIFGVYSASRRVRAMGWWSMTAAAAPAVGLIVGGPLVDWLGWRVVFVLQALFSLLALALAALILRETARQRVRFDVAGSLTVACGVGGFMFALGQVRELGLGSPWVWGAALLGCLGIRGFVVAERRAAAPLLPLEFFRRRNFSAPMLATALMGAAYMGAFVVAPLVLLRVFDFSISAAAGIMLLRTLSLTFSSPLGGAVGMRFGERTAAVLGSGVLTVGLVLVAAGALQESLWILGAGLVLQGMGHGLGLPSLTSSVSNAVPEESLGIASAASRLCNQAGAAMGITLLTLVYGGVNSGRAFALAFCVGAGLSLFSLATSLFMQADAGPARSEP